MVLSILDMTKNFFRFNTESITSILIKEEVETNLLQVSFVSKLKGWNQIFTIYSLVNNYSLIEALDFALDESCSS
jgi:hypothetical protein